MHNSTIARRMTTGFGLVVSVAAIFSVLATIRLATVERLVERVSTDAMPGVHAFGEIQGNAREDLALVLEYVAADEAGRRQRIQQRLDDVTRAGTRLFDEYERTVNDPRDRQLFDAARRARDGYRDARGQILTFAQGHTGKDALAVFDTGARPAFDAYMQSVRAEIEFNQRQSATLGSEIATAVGSAKDWTIVGILVAILTGSGIALIIVRSTNRVLLAAADALNEGSERVVSAASQVATSAQSLSRGASDQAASLQETSASMEQMASMTRKNAENATSAASLVSDVAREMSDANGALAQMVTSMAAIKESGGKVTQIIKTIDEIAFQTNILALNAAVEAARAGGAGLGFAVVADEVRNLAQRSAQAARDTAGLIEESIARSQEGSGRVEEVAAAIATIGGNMSKMTGIVEEVRESSRQQASGIDQVTVSIGQIQKVTQMTAATAEETAAASDELSGQAEGSRLVVRRLKDLIGVNMALFGIGRSARGGAGHVSGPARVTSDFPLTGHASDGRF